MYLYIEQAFATTGKYLCLNFNRRQIPFHLNMKMRKNGKNPKIYINKIQITEIVG